jgi:hypothetical protein
LSILSGLPSQEKTEKRNLLVKDDNSFWEKYKDIKECFNGGKLIKPKRQAYFCAENRVGS